MHNKKSKRCLTAFALFFLLSTLGAGADDSSAHKRIRAAYEKSSTAARYKYLDGMLSLRAPGYIGYGVDGKKVDPKVERANMYRSLTQALQVREKSEIRSYEDKGADLVLCQVHDALHFVIPMPRPRPPVDFVIESDSIDEWKQIGGNWLQISNRLLKQVTDVKPFTPAGDSNGKKPPATH